MKNLLTNLPVVTKEMVANPAIDQILKGAHKMIEHEKAQLDRECGGMFVLERESYLAIEVATRILGNVNKSFEALLHYYIYRSEEVAIPFSVHYRFISDYNKCLPTYASTYDEYDVIIDQAFALIGEYIELIFKAIYPNHVAKSLNRSL